MGLDLSLERMPTDLLEFHELKNINELGDYFLGFEISQYEKYAQENDFKSYEVLINELDKYANCNEIFPNESHIIDSLLKKDFNLLKYSYRKTLQNKNKNRKNFDLDHIDIEYKELAQSIKDYFPDFNYENTRVGSYSCLHYLRQFASLLEVLSEEKKVSIKNLKLTKQDVENLLNKENYKDRTAYITRNNTYFKNLINHSDCDGCYYPFEIESNSLYEGSSIYLLKELNDIKETGAIDFLKQILNNENIKEYYPVINIIYDVYEILSYYCASSVLYNEILVFC